MSMDYPNMWCTTEGGLLRFGYHADKLPKFTGGIPQATVEVKDPEEIKWLANHMEALRQRMWIHGTQTPGWEEFFKETSPSRDLYICCVDGYKATLYLETYPRSIELAYRGVAFVAEHLAKYRDAA